MKQSQIIFIAVVIAIVSGFGGYYLQQLTKDNISYKEQLDKKKSPSPEEVIGTDVPEFSLLDLNGERRYLSEWQGKLIAINFAGTAGSKCTENMWAKDPVTRSEVSNLFQFRDFRSEIGYRAIMTPTVLAAFEEIHKRYCSMPWNELLQPSIDIAKKGLTVSPNLDQYF